MWIDVTWVNFALTALTVHTPLMQCWFQIPFGARVNLCAAQKAPGAWVKHGSTVILGLSSSVCHPSGGHLQQNVRELSRSSLSLIWRCKTTIIAPQEYAVWAPAVGEIKTPHFHDVKLSCWRLKFSVSWFFGAEGESLLIWGAISTELWTSTHHMQRLFNNSFPRYSEIVHHGAWSVWSLIDKAANHRLVQRDCLHYLHILSLRENCSFLVGQKLNLRVSQIVERHIHPTRSHVSHGPVGRSGHSGHHVLNRANGRHIRRSCVKHENAFSQSKPQNAGIRQGCPLSPFLFILVMTLFYFMTLQTNILES